MSTLTGNQIKNTYQGLLKLADSSTGITQNLQAIQDGLGNDTGMKLTEDQLEVPNIASFISLKGKYYGSGFQATSTQQLANGTQNIILAFAFYDKGLYDYSAMTVNIVSATTSSDTVVGAFYTAQMTDNGLYPYAPILSGITIPTSPAGSNVITFPSNLSFSGYGGGIYFLVWKVSNAGVQPTVRYGGTSTPLVAQANNIYGFGKQPGINQYTVSTPQNTGVGFVFTGQTTFDDPFASTLPTLQSTTQGVNGSGVGFILHTRNF